MTTIINASTSAGLISTADTSGILQLQTANTAALTIDASQNVGVGVTPSAWSLKAIEVGAVGNGLMSGGVSDFWMTSNAYYNSGWKYAGTNLASAYEQTIGKHIWLTAASGTAGNAITFTQAMTLNASGNLSLGTTTSNATFTSKASANTYAGGCLALLDSAGTNTSYITSITSALYFSNNGSTNHMVLDASGNLGLATTSPAAVTGFSSNRIVAQINNSGYGQLRLGGSDGTMFDHNNTGSTTTTIRNLYGALDAAALVQIQSGYITFGTGTSYTERARIDSSGNLLVGTTSQISSGLVCIAVDDSVKNPLVIKNTGTTYGSGYHLQLFVNSSGAQSGAIDQTAVTTVNYNTSSDQRLKTDNGIATDGSVIDNIKIHNFTWKQDGRDDVGVFAQEAINVKPSAISIGKDDSLTEDGNLANPWGVDYSKFVPDLIVHAQQLKKQIQEQQALIQQLQTDVATLKGTP